MEPVCTNAYSTTATQQGAGDHQLALWSQQGQPGVCCVPAPGHQLHSSGSKLPSQLDAYNPHHLLEERTGTPLTTRIGHLEASPRAILEFACDIHCLSQQSHLSEDLGGLNFHNRFRPLHVWCLFSLFKNYFLGACKMTRNR